MASPAELAAQLRAKADALEALAGLEENLRAAKRAYEQNPTKQNLAAKAEAMEAVRAARAAARDEGVTVGGDAYVAQLD